MMAADVTFHISVGPGGWTNLRFSHAGDRSCYWLMFPNANAACTLVGGTRGCGDPITAEGQGCGGLRA